MTVRKAEIKDIDDLIKLLGEVNEIHHSKRPDIFKKATKYSKSDLVEILNDETKIVLVTENENCVLGYAFCLIQEHKNEKMLADIKTLYIDDLCVDENHRGKHIGALLYDSVINLAKKLNCHNVTLNAWSLNPGAIAFYEKMGMTPQKICFEKILEN